MATINGTNGNDNLDGTLFSDTMNGFGGNDILTGRSGNDVLNGGNGNDTLNGGTGADHMNGGLGHDTYVVDNVGDVAVELIGGVQGGVDTVESSVSHTLGFGIEDLFLTGTTAINGTGNGNNNFIFGNSANNSLSGLAGRDVLNGGTGADIMNGGDQGDTYIVDNVSDVTVETRNDALGGVDFVRSFVSHTLGFGIEHLELTGTAAFNGTGNGNGNIIFGNSAYNSLSGLAGNDQLFDGNGDDRLDGGTGADRMEGGNGSDTYVVDNVGDVVGEARNDAIGGVDTVESSVNHTLGFGVEHLVLAGTAAINGTGNENDNFIGGNAANNNLSGLAGNDHLDGGFGADRMDGGDGSDFYTVDNVGDVVVEARNDAIGGVDRVNSYVSHTLGFGFEDLVLAGTATINGTGNGNANSITGNFANNSLSGLAGNDFLYGSLGADNMTGGSGNDTFDYNGVNESPAGTGRDVITDFSGAGAALGDQIDLTTIDANTVLADNQAFTYIGGAAFTAAGQLRYSGGILSGNIDADAAAEIEIQLVGSPALTVGGTGTDILL